jgi:hypothetical protein
MLLVDRRKWMSGFVDLHTHTNASDGTERPESNVRLAAEAGLAAVAITDHDTIAGVAAARREGERLGVLVVPGVEISTWAGGQDIHILGYFIDPDDSLFAKRLEKQRRVRETRNDMLIERLQELGLSVTMQEVMDNMARKPLPGECVRPLFGSRRGGVRESAPNYAGGSGPMDPGGRRFGRFGPPGSL